MHLPGGGGESPLDFPGRNMQVLYTHIDFKISESLLVHSPDFKHK